MTSFGTVAVTGAGGLIGRRLIPALLQAGARVRVLSRQPLPPRHGVEAFMGDLCEASCLPVFVDGADAVVHLAGMAHTALRSPKEGAMAANVNVGGTRTLLHAARAAGTRHFVFFSSAHVYAEQSGLSVCEESPKHAGGGYAGLKLQAEELLHREAGGEQTITVLRPCLTYGPGVRFNLQQLMGAVQKGRYVHPGGADVQRSFVSVDTVALATVHLLREKAGGTYNVANREPQSLRRWIDQLAMELDVRSPRVVPITLLRILATAGSVAQRAGMSAPLTTESLRKLTAPFTLNLDRLAATDFAWPTTERAVMQQMVAGFRTGQTAGTP